MDFLSQEVVIEIAFFPKFRVATVAIKSRKYPAKHSRDIWLSFLAFPAASGFSP